MIRLIQAAAIVALCVLVTSPVLAQQRRNLGGSSGWQTGQRSQRSQGPPRGGPGVGGGVPNLAIMRALDSNHDQEISADEIDNAVAALKAVDVDGDGKLTEADERGVNGARRPNRTGPRPQSPRRGRAQPPNIPSEQSLSEGSGSRGQTCTPQATGGSPSPDQFLKHAMEFDLDQNGLLDARELKTFAQHIGPPQRGPGSERGRR